MMRRSRTRLATRPGWRCAFAGVAVMVGVSGLCMSASAAPAVAVAQADSRAQHLVAYARVEPVALVRLAAARGGIVAGLAVLPGQAVSAGAVLADLVGPEVDAMLSARTRAVQSAQAELVAARKLLSVGRQTQRLRLATAADIDRAEAAVTNAQARFDAATAALRAARAETTLHAPASGVVVALRSANGEQVTAGQTILVIQPQRHLWLRASFYGADGAAVRAGMHGRFVPADRAPSVPVKVASVIPAIGRGGATPVGLVATIADPGWTSGTFGRVVLEGPRRVFVAVPTRALILDQGNWWVLVHTPHGDRRRAVVPGPRDGAETLIAQGLRPGEAVVVADAYLRFHQNVARDYQPPD